MILTKHQYLTEVQVSPPLDSFQINDAAFDLRVGTRIYRPAQNRDDILQPGKHLIINAKEHFLIQSLEKVKLPMDVVGVVYPRSGTNRKGITVDMTGIVDPGYEGHLMIPVSNLMGRSVHFYPGERIAQIMFHRCETPTEARESKYQNSSMEAKPDKEEELEMLRSGELLRYKIATLK